MKHRETLRWRLLTASAAWIAATLFVSAIALVLFFRDHIERRFDQSLFDHLEELVAASEVDAGGTLALSWKPFDPRFNRPRSGWYWQVRYQGQVIARSDSLAGVELAAIDSRGEPISRRELAGPGDEHLRAVERKITLPRAQDIFSYMVAGPVADITADVYRFARQIAATMLVLATGLISAVFVQIRYGLKPLDKMRSALSAVRAGNSQRLEGHYPEEIQPLAAELNALIERNSAMLERARAHAADLAHALKNPLAVIRNETRSLPGPSAKLLDEQVDSMHGAIERQLARARAAGGQVRPGQRTLLEPVVDDLSYSLRIVYRDRRLVISTDNLAGLTFLGEREDLEEMLGNLMDNACKWAKSEVRIAALTTDNQRLLITVDDDGPGLPETRTDDVLKRGLRLDEDTPGSGMGLAIVSELVEAYGGSVSLSTSPAGGLRAALNLPGNSLDR